MLLELENVLRFSVENIHTRIQNAARKAVLLFYGQIINYRIADITD